ncbi:uncharacterized protein PGTG_04986 [Puccinia graminis f. sp. tritici CRL 75-36-700-3]|uniref:Uncharacterized protein n=1 Tax=Puccinia graminis f. sp. tritici (strain CRL 75-36-700-3 / race SCCL) TaxID=418459 RepID=E3K3H3_PUCGT|nr:uncharacterized protein PGTG_04986 [Puccinia graminis f. sp. tritici CRL 75-36-700-3]EFP79030.2 hypothetical protein PGTG_04986 [Puccinia graminis f. sp. tritici CRL 75-36-700-3]
MHAFQSPLNMTCTFIILIHIFAAFAALAYPLGSMDAARSSVGEATHLSKRSPEEYDEEQIGVFAEGNGNDRDFIWSKFSYARNFFGAGNPTKEIESMSINLDNL